MADLEKEVEIMEAAEKKAAAAPKKAEKAEKTEE